MDFIKAETSLWGAASPFYKYMIGSTGIDSKLPDRRFLSLTQQTCVYFQLNLRKAGLLQYPAL